MSGVLRRLRKPISACGEAFERGAGRFEAPYAPLFRTLGPFDRKASFVGTYLLEDHDAALVESDVPDLQP